MDYESTGLAAEVGRDGDLVEGAGLEAIRGADGGGVGRGRV